MSLQSIRRSLCAIMAYAILCLLPASAAAQGVGDLSTLAPGLYRLELERVRGELLNP